MKRNLQSKKGATLGITIVIILFLTIIALSVMAMGTIVAYSVKKQDEKARQQLVLKQAAQNAINPLVIVAFTTYEVNGADYDNQIFPAIAEMDLTNETVSYTLDPITRTITFTVTNVDIQQQITTVIKMHTYTEITANMDSFYSIVEFKTSGIGGNGS